MQGRKEGAEELFRNALAVLEYVEDASQREILEINAIRALVVPLLCSDRFEQAAPLMQRFRELAEAATDPRARQELTVKGLAFAVRLEATRGAFSGDFDPAAKEMKVLPQTQSPIHPCAILGTWIPIHNLSSSHQK